MMDQPQWLVVILLPLVWSISLRQVDSARPLQTSSTYQKNTWPWYSILPPIGQPTPNLLSFTLPPISHPQPKVPSLPPPSPLFSFPMLPALPSFSAPKFPSIPPISQPGFLLPPFSQPKPALPSIPPISVPGKPEKSPRWLSLPPLPSWSTSTPPPPTIPSFPWGTPSPPPPVTSSFPWMNPTPPLPTIPSFPWNTPSPPPPSTPSFPWDNPSSSPPPPRTPTFPWNDPSYSPPPLITPTIPTIPAIPVVPVIPSLPRNTPTPPPAIPSFPWLGTPPPAFPSLPWPLVPTAPVPPKDWTGPTLPPFGLPPGGPLFPTGIQFTFSNFSNTWLPDAGVKVTWENVISIELSLQLLVEAIFKPISLIISQFADSSGPESWGWKNGLTDSKYSADVGATCTTLGENGFPATGLIVIQAPIDNTVDTAITWFTVLFNGWSKEKPFNATLDHTPGTFGGFVTNVTKPNLKTFCSHPGSLNRIAAKQGQYVLN